jgi:tetratricopeptide (TPR) repeat protein
MNCTILTRILVAIAAFSSAAYGSSEMDHDPERKTALMGIQEASHASQHGDAERLAMEYVDQWPRDATGEYALAVALQAAVVGCEGTRDTERINESLDRAVILAEDQLVLHPEHHWTRYVLGLALGFQAVNAIQTGDPWRAWRLSRMSVTQLESIAADDSTWADVWLPLGAYYFWRSQALARWTWLPFIDDRRDMGIRKLRYAYENGTTTSVSAGNILVWALITYERPAEALALTDSLLKRHPRNRSLLMARGESLKSMDRLSEALEAFAVLEADYDGDESNCVGKAEAGAKQGVLLAGLGDCMRAIPLLRRAVEYQPVESQVEIYEDVRDEAAKALRWCDVEERTP